MNKAYDMDMDFWLQRWDNNEIGFHESETNPILLKHFSQLSITKGKRIFIPLCGKTLDIAWLLAQGFHVVGAELSENAIKQLFTQLDITPSISTLDKVTHYRAPGLDIFVGDIFNLTTELLGPVDAIYDRAALVALPDELRKKYTSHLRGITRTAPQLLVSYEYDQNMMSGPPFSVSSHMVEQYYVNHYEISLLENIHVAGGLKGICDADEKVWLLTPLT